MPEKSPAEKEYWSACWRKARANMPRHGKDDAGSAQLLCLLLDYPKYSKNGVLCGHSQMIFTYTWRGTKPSTDKRRRKLEMLAGPHGHVLAIAMCQLKGIELTHYKYGPNGKRSA